MVQIALAAALATTPAPVSPLDPAQLAHIAVGEAGGPGLWGTDERAWAIQAMIVWVARNQSLCPSFPANYDPQVHFYAWEELITDGDVDRAAAVLSAPRAEDPTNGALHVISEQDRIKLGFPEGDIVERALSPFALHWYRVWPGLTTAQRL